MNFEKSEMQTMLLDSAERLLSGSAHVEYWREQRETDLGFDESRWSQLAELGWLALPVTEEAGGLGGTLEDVVLLNIAMGKALATEPYVSTTVLCAYVLDRAATAYAIEILGEIAAGTKRVALAHQEMDSDPLSLDAGQTVARRSGEGYIVNGLKFMALDAPSADQFLLSARIEGEDGISLFVLDGATTGLTKEAYSLIDGSRAADIRLTDVALPAEALLLSGEAAKAGLHDAFDRASIAMMAQAVGALEAANTTCGQYVQERKQFGVAIGSFQAIQHIMADMFVAAHQARSMLYHALAHADGHEAARSSAISAARIVIGEASQLVSKNGIQVHGGYGLTDEYAIGHYVRRLMCLEKLFGDLQSHTDRFANGILD